MDLGFVVSLFFEVGFFMFIGMVFVFLFLGFFIVGIYFIVWFCEVFFGEIVEFIVYLKGFLVNLSWNN